MRFRRVLILSAAGILVVAVPVAGVVAASKIKSPRQSAADAAPPPPSLVTAEVERRILADRVVFRGDVVVAEPTVVAPPTASDSAPIVTDIRKKVGDAVKDGDALLVVAGRPMFAMAGAVPMYRDIRPGGTGVDVTQLHKSLTALGYSTRGDPSGTYGPATQAAVAGLYKRAGFETLPSNPNATSEIASSQDQLRQAEQTVASAQTSLDRAQSRDQAPQIREADATVRSAERALEVARTSERSAIADATAAEVAAKSNADGVNADPQATPAAREQAAQELESARRNSERIKIEQGAMVIDATERLDLARISASEALRPPDVTLEQDALAAAEANLTRARDAHTKAIGGLGPFIPRGEVVFIPTLPASVMASTAVIGKPAGGGGDTPASGESAPGKQADLMTISAGTPIVRGTISEEVAALLEPGGEVELYNSTDDATGKAIISKIGDETVDLDGARRGRVIEMQPETPIDGDQLGVNLRVTIETAATKTPMLIVPVAAVSSEASGMTRVSKLVAGKPRDVQVHTRLSADGFIAVEPVNPSALSKGDRVVVGISGKKPTE
ncbi:MAG: hypothetical protein ACSLFB_02950 [Acidimicrobiales bacterium]